jgi:hypothetical protein
MYFKQFITVEPFQHLNKTFYKVYISDKNIKDFYDDLDNYPEIKEFFIKTNISLFFNVGQLLYINPHHSEYNIVVVNTMIMIDNIQLLIDVRCEISDYSEIQKTPIYLENTLLHVKQFNPNTFETRQFYSYDWISVKNKTIYFSTDNNIYIDDSTHFITKPLNGTEEILYLLQN